MASAPANKENVSPEKDIDRLSDSFQKSLSMNHVDKDGRYFLDLMEKESERLTRLCQGTEQDMANKSLPEDGKRFWYKNDYESSWYRVRLYMNFAGVYKHKPFPPLFWSLLYELILKARCIVFHQMKSKFRIFKLGDFLCLLLFH